MNSNGIMELLTSGYSWEQVIYKVIAWEGLDPWDLDLNALANSFVKYIEKMKELDFKIPAKFIMVAAVLLRMKTDHLNFLENGDDDEIVFADEDIQHAERPELVINPITVPPKRRISRKVMITELIASLRKVMGAQERRSLKDSRSRKKIKIRDDRLSQRIAELYRKIGCTLKRLKEDEVEFSKIVDKWENKEVIDTFLPLIYLDSSKKVNCRQEEIFEEIYIKKR